MDPDIIRKLGGPKVVAARLDMTPSGVWRLTRPGADVLPRRQRQLIEMAAEQGLPLDFAHFHRDVDDAAPQPQETAKVGGAQASATRAGKLRGAVAGKAIEERRVSTRKRGRAERS